MFSVWTEVCSGIGERGRDVYCVCVQFPTEVALALYGNVQARTTRVTVK